MYILQAAYKTNICEFISDFVTEVTYLKKCFFPPDVVSLIYVLRLYTKFVIFYSIFQNFQ
jgi:hypothetical protein